MQKCKRELRKFHGKALSTNDFTDGYKAKVDRMVEGTRGYSTYEIAVQNGFEGTEEEWLESLKGEKGDTGDTGGIESISETLQGEEIIIEDACNSNAHLKIIGKTIQEEETIRNVGDDINLFDVTTNDYFLTNNNGLTITSTDKASKYTYAIADETLKISNYDSNGYYWLSKFIKLPKNKNINAKAFSIGTGQSVIIVGINSKAVGTVGTRLVVMNATNSEKSFNTGNYEYYMLCTYDIGNLKLKISEHEITDYSKYRSIQFLKENEDQTVSETIDFPLAEGQTLNNGNYLDEDGVHLTKATITLTGTENWAKSQTVNRYYIDAPANSQAPINGGRNILCSHYQRTNSITGEGIFLNDTTFNSERKLLVIIDNSITTVENWKTYLAQQASNGTPVIIEYELAQEVVSNYTEEQQEAYNKLRLMYEGYNKITCTDEIKPDLELTYYYNNDLNKTYTKRFEKIEKKVDGLKEFKSIAIPANANLNNYKIEGMYYCNSTAIASTISNKPYNDAFSLLVEKHAGYKQTFTVFYTSMPRTWIRNGYNGTWGDWKEVLIEQNTTIGTEYKTGRTKNGKEEYGIEINFGALPNNTFKQVAHGITGTFDLTDIKCKFKHPDGTKLIFGTDGINTTVGFNAHIYGGVNASGVILTTDHNGSSCSGTVELNYIKN